MQIPSNKMQIPSNIPSNITQITMLLVVGMVVALAGTAQAAAVVTLDFAATNGSGPVANLGSSVTLSTTDSGSTTGIGTVQGGVTSNATTVTLVDGVYTGVYEIAVDVSDTGTGAAGVGRGGTGTLSPGGDLFGSGEELTIDNLVLTYVSGDDVFQFDGFIGVLFGNAAGAEVGTANGVDFDSGSSGGWVGNGNLFAPTGAIPLASSVVISGNGMSFNVVDAQFSAVAVPEPSSAALLGLGGLALILRRRK